MTWAWKEGLGARWFHSAGVFAFAAAILTVQWIDLPGDECTTGADPRQRGNPFCIDSSTPPWLLVGLILGAYGATGAAAWAWWRDARARRR